MIYVVDTDTGPTGGSFGVVYKGIEKATGEVVAIKHVSKILPLLLTWLASIARFVLSPKQCAQLT